ncbi:MAG: TonB family protein [Candidatus Omnitrophota bacterium]|nr:TonB family protein [Candidatus Omnitrophota bacterium]
MFLNHTLQVAFLLSFATHILVVTQNPGYLFFSPQGKSRKVEVNYIKTTKPNNPGSKKAGLPRSEPLLGLSSKINMRRRNPPPFIDREALLKADMRAIRKELPIVRPALIKPDIIIIKTKIILPQVDMRKIDNHSYIIYYQDVYEKIRRSAYQNYSGSQTGEVCVTFTISSAGYLTDVRLVEERSKASNSLKDIALASVKNASPFPNFPKEVDYSQLSFNIIIFFGRE